MLLHYLFTRLGIRRSQKNWAWVRKTTHGYSIFARLLGWNKGDFLTYEEISEFCSEYSLTKLRIAPDEEIIEESTEDEWTVFSRAYDFVKNQYLR